MPKAKPKKRKVPTDSRARLTTGFRTSPMARYALERLSEYHEHGFTPLLEKMVEKQFEQEYPDIAAKLADSPAPVVNPYEIHRLILEQPGAASAQRVKMADTVALQGKANKSVYQLDVQDYLEMIQHGALTLQEVEMVIKNGAATLYNRFNDPKTGVRVDQYTTVLGNLEKVHATRGKDYTWRKSEASNSFEYVTQAAVSAEDLDSAKIIESINEPGFAIVTRQLRSGKKIIRYEHDETNLKPESTITKEREAVFLRSLILCQSDADRELLDYVFNEGGILEQHTKIRPDFMLQDAGFRVRIRTVAKKFPMYEPEEVLQKLVAIIRHLMIKLIDSVMNSPGLPEHAAAMIVSPGAFSDTYSYEWLRIIFESYGDLIAEMDDCSREMSTDDSGVEVHTVFHFDPERLTLVGQQTSTMDGVLGRWELHKFQGRFSSSRYSVKPLRTKCQPEQWEYYLFYTSRKYLVGVAEEWRLSYEDGRQEYVTLFKDSTDSIVSYMTQTFKQRKSEETVIEILRAMNDQVAKELGRTPTLEEVSNETNIPVATVAYVQSAQEYFTDRMISIEARKFCSEYEWFPVGEHGLKSDDIKWEDCHLPTTNWRIGLVVQENEMKLIPKEEHARARLSAIFRKKDSQSPDKIIAQIEYRSPGDWSKPRWVDQDQIENSSRYIQIFLHKDALSLLESYNGTHTQETYESFQQKLSTYSALPDHEPLMFDEQFPEGRPGCHVWQMNMDTVNNASLIKLAPISDIDEFDELMACVENENGISDEDKANSELAAEYFEVQDSWVHRAADGSLQVEDALASIWMVNDVMKTVDGRYWINEVEPHIFIAEFKKLNNARIDRKKEVVD